MSAPEPARFVPEALPWFAGTPWWPRFSVVEQRTANRLMGLLVNDIFLLIERDLILPMARSAARDPAVQARPGLPERLAELVADERRHIARFAAFARQHGATGELAVARPPAGTALMARLAGLLPTWRALWWAVLATEEWTITFADQVLAMPDGDAAYCALHAAHRGDERRHVAVGSELGLAWDAAPAWRRAWAARAGVALVRRLLLPCRAPRRLARAFIQQHPRWRSDECHLAQALARAGGGADYWRMVLPLGQASAAGQAWRLRPAFAGLTSPIPGWTP